MSQLRPSLPELESHEAFVERHIGPREVDKRAMLSALGLTSMQALMSKVVPQSILEDAPLTLPESCTEEQVLQHLRHLASENRVYKSFIGMGYHDTYTPPVILRNLLENPAWYTPCVDG